MTFTSLHTINYKTNENLKISLSNCYLISSWILFLSLLISPILGFSLDKSANDSLQFNKIIQDYQTQQLAKIDSIVLAFKTAKKNTFIDYLPNVSYSFRNSENYSTEAYSNRGGFNISYSFSELANNVTNRKRNTIEAEKLRQSLVENLNQKIIKLNADYSKIISDIAILQTDFKILQLSNEIYLLELKKYQNTEISIEEFYTDKKQYLTAHTAFYNRLQTLKNEINFFYKYKIGIELKNSNSETLLISSLERKVKSISP